jgi:hypothetical protein
MKKGQMSLFTTSDLGQTIMVAKDLLTVACDYVAKWGEGCLDDPDTPAFIRSIFSDQGMNAVQKAG